MKKYFSGITLKTAVIGSAGLVLGTTAVRAQEMTGSTQAQDAAPVQAQESTPLDAKSIYISDHGWYVDCDVGVNFASNLNNDGDLSSIFEPSQEVSLNPGVSAFVSVGYSFRLTHRWSMAPEIEVGVMYNTFGSGTGLDSSLNPVKTSGGGAVIQAPLLINEVVNCKITPRWSIYAGFGLGILYTDDSVSNSELSNLSAEYGSFTFDLKAGVQCRLGPGDLGLGYKYIANIGTIGVSNNGVNNNVVEASYTIHF